MTIDPGAEELYSHLYLRRQAVKHLIDNWDLLGEDITNDVTNQYGRPDSELNGKLIMRKEGRGKSKREIYGFSVK